MKNIFVGNLDFKATEEGVRSLFERYGVVNSARIMTDREAGRSRGFAFVEMENENEANNAINALRAAHDKLAEAVKLTGEPGDVFVMRPDTFHTLSHNCLDEPRMMLVKTWSPAGAEETDD